MPMPELMRKIVLARDPDKGGCNCLITGRLGSGKTSLLCDLARSIQVKKLKHDERPEGEKLFWRGQASCQFMKFHNKGIPYNVFIPETIEVNFVSNQDITIDTESFETLEELYDKAEADKINVVYFSMEELVDFMEWLQENIFNWNSIFVDEVENLAPQGSAQEWERNQRVANVLKEARKYLLSFYSTTQSHSDIDWRVRKKIQAPIFLQGANPMDNSPVWRKSIQSLDIGEAWVSVGGNYETFEFPPYPTKIDVRARIEDDSLKKIPVEEGGEEKITAE